MPVPNMANVKVALDAIRGANTTIAFLTETSYR